MLFPVESIIDGTWASGAPPREYHDFLLMKHMRWSWEQLEATPAYVKKYCWDFLQRQFEKENDELETARRRQNQNANAGGH